MIDLSPLNSYAVQLMFRMKIVTSVLVFIGKGNLIFLIDVRAAYYPFSAPSG